MRYDSDIQSETDKFLYFRPFFALLCPPPPPPLYNPQNQNFEKMKKASAVSSFYTCVPKITIICDLLQEKGPSSFAFPTALRRFELSLTVFKRFCYINTLLKLG